MSPTPNLSPRCATGNSQTSRRWRCGDPEEYVYTLPKNEGNPLANICKRMKEFDKEKCDAWRDEVEKVLIFAGLFSATITTFSIESYKWLKQDQTELSANLLAQLSQQLSAIASNATAIPSIVQMPFVPDPRSVRINIVWFISLIMSLATVFFGILSLQWLREFARDRSLPPEEAIPTRQLCYDGLFAWRVPFLISALPVLLQASVLLFFIGVLDLMWSLNWLVATFITALIALIVALITFTTMAPVVQMIRRNQGFPAELPWCPYKSPLSLAFFRVVMAITKLIVYFVSWSFNMKDAFARHMECNPLSMTWMDVELIYHYDNCQSQFPDEKQYNVTGFARALAWTMAMMRPHLNRTLALDIFHSLNSVLPKVTATKIMHQWASQTSRTSLEHDELDLALGPDISQDGGTFSQVKYDLLLAGLLRRCFPGQDDLKLLLELRLRYWNTVGQSSRNNISAIIPFSLEDDPNNDDHQLLFQVLVAALENTNLDGNPVTIGKSRYLVHFGRSLAQSIRYTPVTVENVRKTEEVFGHIKRLFDYFHTTADQWTNKAAWIGCIGDFIHDVDLRTLQIWETDMCKIIGNDVELISAVVPFMENILLPAYRKLEPKIVYKLPNQFQALCAQLRAFQESKPYSYYTYVRTG